MDAEKKITPVEQLSKVFGSYRAEWLKEQVFELFTEPTYFPELKTERPCVLEGGRGTGKTTVLRGLSYQGQFALSGKDLAAIEKWHYIGLYYRVNTNRVTAFRGPELDNSSWSRLFAHYLNLLVCEQMITFLNWYYSLCPDAEKLSAESCEAVSRSLHLNGAESYATLLQKISLSKTDFEAYINNVVDGGRPRLSIQGAPIDLLSAEILSLNQFKGKQFYLLFDEYENFEDYQQQIINTLIKHSTEFYTFKIGVRELGWRQKSTLNENERLVSPADYSIINIVQKLSDGKFRLFAEKVCNDRISRLILTEPTAIGDIKQVLPGLTEDDEADLLGINAVIDEQRKVISDFSHSEMAAFDKMSSLQKYFCFKWAACQGIDVKDVINESVANYKQWDERYNNYKHALLYTVRKGKRGIRKFYSGWNVYLKLAAGNIRYLLELVEQSYIMHLQEEGKLSDPVTYETQTKTAQNVGKKNLSELEGLSVNGAQIAKLLLGLGRVFQVMASDVEGHTLEVNQFQLKTNKTELSSDIDAILTSAVMHLGLIRSPGNKLGDVGDTREYEYMIHPIFSPFFEYSYRKKRKILLEEDDIKGFTNHPKETIRRVLKKNNREEVTFLPEQLHLFEMYYDSNQ